MMMVIIEHNIIIFLNACGMETREGKVLFCCCLCVDDATNVFFPSPSPPSLISTNSHAGYVQSTTRLYGKILSVNLNNHLLEEIGKQAFENCTSLESAIILLSPPAVKAIKHHTFSGCTSFATVKLGERLKEVGSSSICQLYTTFQHIVILHCKGN
jgi:hypothetical protein